MSPRVTPRPSSPSRRYDAAEGDEPRRRIRVLIVDDDDGFRATLEIILSLDPRMQVVGRARDGVEAVELAKRLRPDLTLVDIQMPRLDGFGVIEHVRAHDPDACIVVLSASKSLENERRAIAAGAVAFLDKNEAVEIAATAAEIVQGAHARCA